MKISGLTGVCFAVALVAPYVAFASDPAEKPVAATVFSSSLAPVEAPTATMFIAKESGKEKKLADGAALKHYEKLCEVGPLVVR